MKRLGVDQSAKRPQRSAGPIALPAPWTATCGRCGGAGLGMRVVSVDGKEQRLCCPCVDEVEALGGAKEGQR